MKVLVYLPFGINPVKGKGHDRQCVGIDGVLRPCGVDFGRHYILDIIPVTHIVVGGGGVVGNAVVHDDELRDHHAA